MEKRTVYRQILVAIIANISSFGVGLAMGWTSPNVPKLQNELLQDTPLDRVLTASEVGWIGSLLPIGGAISPFFAGIIAGKFGRKLTMISSGFCLLAAYIILGFGQNIELIYTARLFHGLSFGLTMTVIPMYIGEITQDSLRGALGSLMMLFLNAGVLFVYCVGPFVSYEIFQFICALFPLSFLVLIVFMPESPTYYLIEGSKEKAIHSLMFLRNSPETSVTAEIDIIQHSIDQTKSRKGSWKDLYSTRGNIRALIIGCGLMWAQQFSGIKAVVFYAQTIFERAGGDLSPAIASIIIGTVLAVASWIVPYTIERYGRKISLMASSIAMGIATVLMSIYFFLDNGNSAIVDSLSFLPIISLVIYTAFFSIGYGPIPWALMGEIFGPDIRTYATMISSTTCSVSGAIVLLFFESLNETIGPHWVFVIFTVCIVIGGIFILFIVIETKGLTLLEIQERLNKR